MQYIGYEACINSNLFVEAEEIQSTYLKLIETNYQKTGRLWEKYNGITGEVANEDYEAPTMMGWTAGLYWCFICGKSGRSYFWRV